MDRTTVFGTVDVGSIPTRRTLTPAGKSITYGVQLATLRGERYGVSRVARSAECGNTCTPGQTVKSLALGARFWEFESPGVY